MADIVGMTVLAAYPHRDLLEKYEYIRRKNYRQCVLNPNALQDPLLTSILSLSVEFYKDENGLTLARKRE